MTNETKHTPAPWRHEPSIPQVEAFYPNGNRSLQVIISCQNDKYEANANLIAAAPELLEALGACLDCPEMNLDEMDTVSVDAVRQGVQAIKKAKGEV